MFGDIMKIETVIGRKLLYTAFIYKNDTLFYIMWSSFDTIPRDIDTIPLFQRKNILLVNSKQLITPTKVVIKENKVITYEKSEKSKKWKFLSKYKKRRKPLYKKYKYFNKLDKIFICR